MTPDEIEAINAETRRKLAVAGGNAAALESETFPYYGYVGVTVPGCSPFTLFTNNDSPVVESLILNLFEPQSLKLWLRLCRVATGILDIGANVGIYSLCAASARPDLQIHAFEPNPYAYARLRMHIVLNQLTNIVEHTAGVGPEDGMTGFGWKRKAGGNISSGGNFGNYQKASYEKTLVRVMKIDGSGIAQTLGDRPLAKIDVEGAELIVLDAMTEVLAKRPDLILETFDAGICQRLNAQLLPQGYRVYQIDEYGGRLIPREQLIPGVKMSLDHNFNQLLTTRSAAEIDALMAA